MGQSGRALTFWKLYQNLKHTDIDTAQAYLKLSVQYIESSLANVSEDYQDYVSFLYGNPGVYATAAVIYDTMGEFSKSKIYIAKINEYLEDPLTHRTDYDSGLAGLLFTI